MTCHCDTDLNALAEHGREDLSVVWDVTPRGFRIGTFRDLYGQECSVQESSSAEYAAIWFGVGWEFDFMEFIAVITSHEVYL